MNFGAFDIHWQSWVGARENVSNGRLSEMIAPAEACDEIGEFRRRLIAMAPAERFELVYATVTEKICEVLRIPTSRVDAKSNLTELGIDSLMALEVALSIEEAIGYRFRALSLVRGPTIAEMSRVIIEKILSNA
jgi:acyl carrier protein